ncbi:FG-GAP-like repeat-containing protein [Streptomyces sp. NPDC049555]|uniref:FG-GAP-like repeat-containing protein n=1 Tax=unclassified Streptomyces TaxID=2593676 RepID=UPI00341EF8C9
MARHGSARRRSRRRRPRRGFPLAVVACVVALAALVWPVMTLLGGTESEAVGRAWTVMPTWTRTWGTAMATAGPAAQSKVTGRQTLRMVVHTSIAGASARIHLVNTFGTEPVTIGRATIARQSIGATADAPPLPLTFGGAPGTVLAPGGSVYSDPAAFPVKADENLLVSLHLPDRVNSAPFHDYTRATSFASAPGDAADRTAESAGNRFPTSFTHWAFLSGVDVMARSGGTVVLLGDSQTDGGHTTTDANRRWPNAYGRVLQAREKPMGVVNAGISGNRILGDGDPAEWGESALKRFDRDVLAQTNVKSVIFYEGINDIVFGKATASDLAAAIGQLAARAHAAKLTFTVATIPPFKGFKEYTPAMDRERQALNDRIRTMRDIDGYVDFDAAMRDPLNPARIFAAYYNRGDDRLHFADNGNQALADAVAPARSPVPTGPAPTASPSPTAAPTATAPPPPGPQGTTEIVAADFTGDGIPDLVTREANGELRLRAGNKDVDDSTRGDGTFGSPKRIMQNWDFTEAVAADFTGDGKADLLAKDAAGNLQMWAGKGNGTFATPRKVAGGWTSTQTVAADFTGDGVPDLVAREGNGDLKLWPGSKNLAFGSPRLVQKTWNFTETVAADFTGDGKADLLAKDAGGKLHLWTGRGDGTFAAPRNLTGGWTYADVTAFPLRKGGIAHLLGRNPATGALHEWLNTGNATFSRPLRLADGW